MKNDFVADLRIMNITVVPSEAFNAKYQLPVPLEAIEYPIE